MNLLKPSVSRPYRPEELDFSATWRPYPESEPVVEVQTRVIDDAGFSLYEIGVYICSILLSGGPHDSPLPGYIILEPFEKLKRAQAIEHSLLAWHDALPTVPLNHGQVTIPHLAGPNVNLQ